MRLIKALPNGGVHRFQCIFVEIHRDFEKRWHKDWKRKPILVLTPDANANVNERPPDQWIIVSPKETSWMRLWIVGGIEFTDMDRRALHKGGYDIPVWTPQPPFPTEQAPLSTRDDDWPIDVED